jgi:hypothetical protein
VGKRVLSAPRRVRVSPSLLSLLPRPSPAPCALRSLAPLPLTMLYHSSSFAQLLKPTDQKYVTLIDIRINSNSARSAAVRRASLVRRPRRVPAPTRTHPVRNTARPEDMFAMCSFRQLGILLRWYVSASLEITSANVW